MSPYSSFTQQYFFYILGWGKLAKSLPIKHEDFRECILEYGFIRLIYIKFSPKIFCPSIIKSPCLEVQEAPFPFLVFLVNNMLPSSLNFSRQALEFSNPKSLLGLEKSPIFLTHPKTGLGLGCRGENAHVFFNCWSLQSAANSKRVEILVCLSM